MWRIARVEGLLERAPGDTPAVDGAENGHSTQRTDSGIGSGVTRSHITHFVRGAPVVAWCLARLRQTVQELACPVRIARLVMHPQPFCPENGLQTPTFRLRRDRIRNAFVTESAPARNI